MNVVVDVSNVVLQTERLVLRPFEQKDLNDFFKYASVEGVGEMAGWPHHKNISDSQKILDLFIAHKKTFALVKDDIVIGSLGIEEYDENIMPELNDYKCRELGFVLSKDYWGQGLMAEAVNKVIEYCFEQLSLDVIVCGHFAYNKQSESVQRKVGFKKFKEKDVINNGISEKHIYNILRKEDWIK